MSAILNPVPQQPQAPPPAPAPVAKPEGPKRAWAWLVAIVLMAAIGYGIYTWRAQVNERQQVTAAPVKTAKVAAGALVQSIRIAGQTSAREFVNVTAPRLTGPEANRPLILLKLAQTGVMVKKGDLLAAIDGQSLQDHIDDVHSTVLQAEADLKKRRAEQAVEWESLQQSVRLAKAELDKMQAEARAAEVRTAVDQQLIKLSVEEAEAKYKQLLEETTLKKASHESEIRILDYTRLRHTRHRDRHKKDLTRFTIYSPIDGLAVVQSVFRGGEFQAIGEGDQVFPGQLMVKVVNPRSMQVEGMVNQTESGKFRLGQEAKITLDAFPGIQLKGKVYSIGAIAISGFRQQAYIRNIPIRVTIDEYDPRLIPDLSAGADVVIERQENATIVPLGAIRNEGGKAIAYVKSGNGFSPREVKLGDRNEIQAAVLSGLSAGDEVALNYEVASK